MLGAVISIMGGGYDPDAIIYFDRLSQLGPDPSSAYRTAANNLIVDFKNKNNWNNIDRLWPLATEYEQHSLVDLKNPVTSPLLTPVNNPTWTSNEGYMGGPLKYIDTNYVMAASSIYLLNDASYGCYIRTDLAANSTQDMGVIDTSASNSGVSMNTKDNADNLRAVINFNGSPGQTTSVDSRGLTVMTRSNSTTKEAYKNGVAQGSETENSTGRSISSLYLLCRNFLNIPNQFSDRQMSIAFTGNNSIDQSTFYSSIQSFATARGFNV